MSANVLELVNFETHLCQEIACYRGFPKDTSFYLIIGGRILETILLYRFANLNSYFQKLDAKLRELLTKIPTIYKETSEGGLAFFYPE